MQILFYPHSGVELQLLHR
uniref:Uncharacterized protein n=1 Tax=Rhizophora mucronata TaxID=61149 RepID=A0A2P2PZW7_RHIMU